MRKVKGRRNNPFETDSEGRLVIVEDGEDVGTHVPVLPMEEEETAMEVN